MKKLYLLLGCLGICLGTLIPSHAAETITIATGEYAPWTGEKINQNGFVCHVTREAFAKAGYTVTFKFFPWKRVETELLDGNVDAAAYFYKSAEREQKCLYSDTLTEEEIVFFFLKTNPMKEWNTLPDLKGLKIGAARGYTYTDEFWELAKTGVLTIDEAVDDKTNFKKLIAKRIDIAPATSVTGMEMLRKDFAPGVADTIDYNPKPLVITTGHLLFSKNKENAPKLLEAFNKKLAELKSNGAFAKYKDDLIKGVYSK